MTEKIYLGLFIIVFTIFGHISTQAQERRAVDSETLFEKVFKILEEKPKWLFSSEICPVEIIPKITTKLNYFKEECAENAEKCLNECKNSDGNSCYALALHIQEEKGLSNNSSEALFQRSCKLGIISGCTNRAADILNREDADEKSVKCSVKTFEKTCELNDSWGCVMFGMLLIRGEGVQKDDEKALKVLSKSCINGETHEACQAGKKLIETIKNPPKQN